MRCNSLSWVTIVTLGFIGFADPVSAQEAETPETFLGFHLIDPEKARGENCVEMTEQILSGILMETLQNSNFFSCLNFWHPDERLWYAAESAIGATLWEFF